MSAMSEAAQALKGPDVGEYTDMGPDERVFDDVELSRQGIDFLLNNKFENASALFSKYKNESALMHAGYSFVYFMEGLMTYEEEQMARAVKALEETQKACEVGDGFVRSVRRKLQSKKRRKEAQDKDISLEEKIQRQVIIGDCLLYQSVLVFTGQDLTSLVKGGWLLRKAYKIYEKLYKEVTNLREKYSKLKSSQSQGSISIDSISSMSDGPIDGNENEIPSKVLDRLQGSVNFGYGTFQICLSMIPPKILKIIEFLGFEGDRQKGLECLMYTANSRDMKAPLAILALLWYHTVLRPFFALDGANGYDAGCSDAEKLIEENTDGFPNSCLFLFFRGRIHRLRKNTDLSLSLYNEAFEAANGQKELELMCLYEIGWCNLMKLNWQEGLRCFSRLKQETKWSKCYYAFMEAVCHGSLGNLDTANELFKTVPGLLKSKNNQIEVYAARRAQKMKKEAPSQEYCRLLTLELVFLWHALPTCTEVELRKYLEVCDMQTDIKTFHVRSLLEGAVYKLLGEDTMALQCLEEAIARHSGMKDDLHVPPFAMFEMSSILLKKPETAGKAKSMLLLIKDNHKDYDFENRLAVRVNNSLKDMKDQAKLH